MPKTPATKKASPKNAPPKRASKGNGAGAGRREQRRLLHQDLSRSQLLDAAEEVFGHKGFHDTTLKEVAELAEFSVGSVYSFFENKDDLFLHVFLRRGTEFMPGIEASYAAGGTAVEQLHRLVDFEVGFFRLHPHFGRLYLRSGGNALPGPEMPEAAELLANFERAMEIQAAIFAQGQAEKVFRAGDPLVLGRLLTGLIFSYQSMDPAVVSDDPSEGERMPLVDLHAIIDAAFGS